MDAAAAHSWMLASYWTLAFLGAALHLMTLSSAHGMLRSTICNCHGRTFITFSTFNCALNLETTLTQWHHQVLCSYVKLHFSPSEHLDIKACVLCSAAMRSRPKLHLRCVQEGWQAAGRLLQSAQMDELAVPSGSRLQLLQMLHVSFFLALSFDAKLFAECSGFPVRHKACTFQA